MSRINATALILTLALLSVFTIIPTLAAEAKTTAPVFGTVDVEKAFNEYNKKQSLEQEFQSFARQLQSKLEIRQANKLLSEEEIAQLADLKAKPNPTPAEKKTIEDLLAKSRDLDKEMAALQQKPNPSSDESARLKELQERANKCLATLEQEQNSSVVELRKRQTDLSQQISNDVETAVAAVAKEKGLSMVFNKSTGQITFVVYSSIDITDDVLKKLNKN